MAPVHIEAEYKTFNMNTQKFEQLLHNFFGASCLNIDIYDENKRRHMPQEWFIAPIDVIDKAIELIISGSIINFKYDPLREEIVSRELKWKIRSGLTQFILHFSCKNAEKSPCQNSHFNLQED